jgi:serine/threonine protein kinase
MRTNVGSIVWAAPETLVDERYNAYDFSCDIYSLGIILWEMWAREEPFKEITSSWGLRRMIVEKKLRPPLHPEWPQPLTTLMKWCWSEIPAARPLAVQVHLCLHDNRLLLCDTQDETSQTLCRNMRLESVRLRERCRRATRQHHQHQSAQHQPHLQPEPGIQLPEAPSLSLSLRKPGSRGAGEEQLSTARVIRVGSPPASRHPVTGGWAAEDPGVREHGRAPGAPREWLSNLFGAESAAAASTFCGEEEESWVGLSRLEGASEDESDALAGFVEIGCMVRESFV